MVDITIIYFNTGKQYRYRGSVRIQENDTVLKNSISTGFKLFTTIKERIIAELLSRQAGMQVCVHSRETKQAGAKQTYNTIRHHIWRDFRSRRD